MLIVKLKACVLLQQFPVTLCLQLVNDVVGRWCDNQRSFELDWAVFFQVTQHLSDDLHIAFVHHARANEAEVDFLGATVVRSRTNSIVRVTLGYVFIVDVRVSDHGLVDRVQIHFYFSVVLGVIIRSQCRCFTGFHFGDTLVGQVDQALQHLGIVIHALVDHDLDAALGQFQRLDQGFIGGDTDRSLGFHLCSPVGEGKGLVCHQCADLYFDDAALEDVFAIKLLKHLCLRGVYHVTEVHVWFHVAFKGHFHRLRNWHGALTGRQCDGYGTGVGAEGNTLGHTGVRVTTDDDGTIVHSNVVQYFVDDVGHGRVNAFRITRSDHAEVVHELHQARNVGLRLGIPYRCSVTTGLVCTINTWRDSGGSHGFQFLRGHQTSRVLRANDVDLHTYV